MSPSSNPVAAILDGLSEVRGWQEDLYRDIHRHPELSHQEHRTAGLAAVRAYREPGFYDHIRAVGERLFGGLNALFDKHGVPGRAQGLGARFGIYFGVEGPLVNYRDAVGHQRETMLRFIAATIDEGVYFRDTGASLDATELPVPERTAL